MAIRIITDSTSDISLKDAKKLGIDIVPLSVIFGGGKYTDGAEITNAQFYEMLAQSDTLPTTSQVNPDGFESLFKSYIEAGDDIIGIFLSSKLSGTYQSACIVKDALGSGRIFIVDSKSATFGLALLALQAVKLRDSGVPAEGIYAQLMGLRDKVKFFAVVDTLKYLKMGGRLSSHAAILGGMLHIKPLVSIIDGEVKSIGKERGQSAAFSHLMSKINEFPPDTEYPVVFGHSNSPQMSESFISFIQNGTGLKPDYVCEIGAVIGTHSGPGCVGLAFIPV